jgi:hypothetical protein
MTPYQRARDRHLIERTRFSFEEAIDAHGRTGYVIINPDIFLLVRPVDSLADSCLYDDPYIEFKETDCWHVYLAAGDIRQMPLYVPHPMPLISYVRKNRLRLLDGLSLHHKLIEAYGRGTTGSTGAVEPNRAATTHDGASSTSSGSSPSRECAETGEPNRGSKQDDGTSRD